MNNSTEVIELLRIIRSHTFQTLNELREGMARLEERIEKIEVVVQDLSSRVAPQLQQPPVIPTWQLLPNAPIPPFADTWDIAGAPSGGTVTAAAAETGTFNSAEAAAIQQALAMDESQIGTESEQFREFFDS